VCRSTSTRVQEVTEREISMKPLYEPLLEVRYKSMQPERHVVTKRWVTSVIGLSMLALTACGTLTGAGVGAVGGAAIGYGTGYGTGKGALIGTGVGAAAGAIYDLYKSK
jgi:hypothetical protein